MEPLTIIAYDIFSKMKRDLYSNSIILFFLLMISIVYDVLIKA